MERAERLLTPAEAAERLGVHTKTITRWASTGALPCIRTLGGHRRYREADVDAAIERFGRRADGRSDQGG